MNFQLEVPTLTFQKQMKVDHLSKVDHWLKTAQKKTILVARQHQERTSFLGLPAFLDSQYLGFLTLSVS